MGNYKFEEKPRDFFFVAVALLSADEPLRKANRGLDAMTTWSRI
jgi:hypothetical protein